MTVNKTGFLCNVCGNELLEENCEIYCSNESCFVDWTPDEVVRQFLEFKGCIEKPNILEWKVNKELVEKQLKKE